MSGACVGGLTHTHTHRARDRHTLTLSWAAQVILIENCQQLRPQLQNAANAAPNTSNQEPRSRPGSEQQLAAPVGSLPAPSQLCNCSSSLGPSVCLCYAFGGRRPTAAQLQQQQRQRVANAEMLQPWNNSLSLQQRVAVCGECTRKLA